MVQGYLGTKGLSFWFQSTRKDNGLETEARQKPAAAAEEEYNKHDS